MFSYFSLMRFVSLHVMANHFYVETIKIYLNYFCGGWKFFRLFSTHLNFTTIIKESWIINIVMCLLNNLLLLNSWCWCYQFTLLYFPLINNTFSNDVAKLTADIESCPNGVNQFINCRFILSCIIGTIRRKI